MFSTSILDVMSETDRIKALELMMELDARKTREASKTDFLKFVQTMWPEFIHGSHHAKMAKAFERVANGELKRLVINMPPRHTKSEFASYMLPAWFLGYTLRSRLCRFHILLIWQRVLVVKYVT